MIVALQTSYGLPKFPKEMDKWLLEKENELQEGIISGKEVRLREELLAEYFIKHSEEVPSDQVVRLLADAPSFTLFRYKQNHVERIAWKDDSSTNSYHVFVLKSVDCTKLWTIDENAQCIVYFAPPSKNGFLKKLWH